MKRRKLNLNGVKDSGDCWRTFNDEHFVMWSIQRGTDTADCFRRHGVRARLRDDMIFVHHADVRKANRVNLTLRLGY